MCTVDTHYLAHIVSTVSTRVTSYLISGCGYYLLCIECYVLSIVYVVTLASTMQADAVTVEDSSVCARLHSAACQWAVGRLSSLSAV